MRRYSVAGSCVIRVRGAGFGEIQGGLLKSAEGLGHGHDEFHHAGHGGHALKISHHGMEETPRQINKLERILVDQVCNLAGIRS